MTTKATTSEVSFSNSLQSYTNSGSAGGTGYYINIGGIKYCWGITNAVSTSTTQTTNYSISFPAFSLPKLNH